MSDASNGRDSADGQLAVIEGVCNHPLRNIVSGTCTTCSAVVGVTAPRSASASTGTYVVELRPIPDEVNQELIVIRNGAVELCFDDRIEPEDNLFYRDWKWVPGALREAYAYGLADGRISASAQPIDLRAACSSIVERWTASDNPHSMTMVLDEIREALGASPAPVTSNASPAPIPMVLHCPDCRARHIDEGDFATKPHHTHSCQSCGLTWRPSVVPTVGVQFLPGFKNDAPCTGSPQTSDRLATAVRKLFASRWVKATVNVLSNMGVDSAAGRATLNEQETIFAELRAALDALPGSAPCARPTFKAGDTIDYGGPYRVLAVREVDGYLQIEDSDLEVERWVNPAHVTPMRAGPKASVEAQLRAAILADIEALRVSPASKRRGAFGESEATWATIDSTERHAREAVPSSSPDSAKLARIRQIINWTAITTDHRERQVMQIIAVLDGSDQFTRPDPKTGGAP